MKPLLLFLFIALVFLTRPPAFAQHWHPARPGRSYHFTDATGDSLFVWQVTGATALGPDSAFTLNPMAVAANGSWTRPPGCPRSTRPDYQTLPDHLLGHRIISRANGDQVFEVGTESLELRTRVAVGQSWYTTLGLHVTLVSRAVEPVLGSLTDSVLTYQLMSAGTLRLSRRYGLLLTPELLPSFYGRPARRTLSLAALPELGIGQGVGRTRWIYDFQPADKFLYHRIEGPHGLPCGHFWQMDSVLSRTDSPGGDTITYQLLTARLQYASGPQCPVNLLFTTPHLTTLVVTSHAPPVPLLTGGFPSRLPHNAPVTITTRITRGPRFGRFEVHAGRLFTDSCAASFHYASDDYNGTSYGTGLGKTGEFHYGFSHAIEGRLEAYVKGTEAYGTWSWPQLVRQVLATSDPITASPLELLPNPFSSDPELRLPTTPHHPARLQVFNALGQLVLSRELAPGSPAALRLPLASQPAGLYHVRLYQGSRGWTTPALKIP